MLAAHIALAGAPLKLSGAARSPLRLTSDPTACAAAPLPAGWRAAPPGSCALHAGGASRLLDLRAGASLSLSGVALLGGAAPQGAAALVLDGSALVASDCLIADARAIGDGGAVLALAGATVSLDGCAPPPGLPRLLLPALLPAAAAAATSSGRVQQQFALWAPCPHS
jgi:hypothetical protein